MPEPIACALIVVSDRAARGERADATEALIRPILAARGFDLRRVAVVPDERSDLVTAMRSAAAVCPLVLTTGGTGVSARDVTPEATREVLDLEVPGLGETMRARSLAETPHALGSRALGGFCGASLIVNLPGVPRGRSIASCSLPRGFRT